MPDVRRRMIAALARLATAAFVLVVVVAPAAADDDRFEPVRKRIAKALVDHSVPSIAVAVAHEGEIVWEQGFGWADRENRTPATQHTLYSVASVSKPITATGLMLLVQRKQIDLDKPINDYLGGAKLRARIGNADDATVRRVANHTSGLPLHYQFFYEDESYRPPARDETIRRFGNLMTPPGEHYQYSNLGYGVLDYVVQRAGKRPFADFMREEVFLPLGMTHTSIGVGSGLEPHQAIRYTPDGKPIPFYEFDHPGASAVYASAHDLARFAMFHMKEHLPDQKQILSDASIDDMQVPTADSGLGSGYGIGWGSFDHVRGYHIVQHTGGMPGVATLCSFVPSERLAIVVLSNSRNPTTSYLRDMILAIVLPERKADKRSGDAAKSDGGASSDDGSSAGGRPTLPDLAGKWKGKLVTYRSEIPLVLEVKDGNDVHLRLGRQLETLLSGANYRGGWLRGRFASDIGTDDDRGRPYQLQLEVKHDGDTLRGPVSAITLPDAWGSSAVTHWVELARQPDKRDEPSPDSNAARRPAHIENKHLPNSYRLTDKVISGGQPEGDVAFAALRALGVRTIISVDGARPDVAAARKHGLRYVHLPHGYDGIADGRLLELAKAVRDLPGPIYIHCHHGKHRSPAAAAAACVSVGMLNSDEALAVLKTAGTSRNYRGLYDTVAAARRLDPGVLDRFGVEFHEAVEVPPLAVAMVAIEHIHDRLAAVAGAGWQAPPEDPDLDPPHEALLLKEQFVELSRAVFAKRPAEFKAMLHAAEQSAGALESALREPALDAQHASRALAKVTKNCQACHQAYRDVPLGEKAGTRAERKD